MSFVLTLFNPTRHLGTTITAMHKIAKQIEPLGAIILSFVDGNFFSLSLYLAEHYFIIFFVNLIVIPDVMRVLRLGIYRTFTQ